MLGPMTPEIIQSINKVGNTIIHGNKASLYTYKKNREIDFYKGGKPCLFFLSSGTVSVYDEHNDVLLYNVTAPFILGLDQLFLSDKQQSIKFESDAKVWSISKEEAIAFFDACAVWREISILLAYVSDIFFSRYALSASCDVYGIIKSHIEYIWRLPEPQRKHISVIDFILKRNKISRSSVYRIIRDLNDGGYIKTVRGKLHMINHIPQKY